MAVVFPPLPISAVIPRSTAKSLDSSTGILLPLRIY